MVARLQYGVLLLAQESAKWGTRSETLRHADSVRLEAELLVTEQGPEPSHTGLHFVGDEHEIVFVTPRAHLLEVVRRGHVHSTLALDRLKHHSAGLIVGRSLDRIDVVIVNIYVTGSQRAPVVLIVRLAGGGHHTHRAAVEGIIGRNDLVGAVFLDLAVFTGKFCDSFVGFGPRVAEEDPVHDRIVYQDLGQLELWDRVEQIGHLEDLAGLLNDGRSYGGV